MSNEKLDKIIEVVSKNTGIPTKDININSKSDDCRSYHVSSEKIRNILGFSTKYTVKDAVSDLKNAFEKGLLPNSMEDEKYFNIKRMQSIQLC